MSTHPLLPPPVPPPPVPSHVVRVEYLGFENLAEQREYRLRVYGLEGWSEFRLRIAVAAFGAGRVRLQDGPDVCYQKLLRAIACGEAASADAITLDEVDFASYREAHTHVPKHRSWSPSSPPAPAAHPPAQRRTPSPRLPVAPLVADLAAPALEQGQRVSHAVFGAGVTTSSSGGHTVVRFDRDGSRTFITSMLELDVLSAPHTWETGPRGVNRPCRTHTPAAEARRAT